MEWFLYSYGRCFEWLLVGRRDWEFIREERLRRREKESRAVEQEFVLPVPSAP
jgi:hypothetical protein